MVAAGSDGTARSPPSSGWIHFSEGNPRKFGQKAPMGRPAQPEEIAPAYVFFASEADSSYITGEVITLLGGDTTAG